MQVCEVSLDELMNDDAHDLLVDHYKVDQISLNELIEQLIHDHLESCTCSKALFTNKCEYVYSLELVLYKIKSFIGAD